MIDIRFLLSVDDDARLYMLGIPEINEPFIARIVHESDPDRDDVILSGISIGVGQWTVGGFEFFGDTDNQWANDCIDAAGRKLGEWFRQGRLDAAIGLRGGAT